MDADHSATGNDRGNELERARRGSPPVARLRVPARRAFWRNEANGRNVSRDHGLIGITGSPPEAPARPWGVGRRCGEHFGETKPTASPVGWLRRDAGRERAPISLHGRRRKPAGSGRKVAGHSHSRLLSGRTIP